ncbi:MAG: molybdopterin-binding protein [Nitrososphaeria archaeon]
MMIYNVSAEEALKIVEENFKGPLRKEVLDPLDAVGRVVLEDYLCRSDHPDRRRSTVDGYVVSSRASSYKISGTVALGERPPERINEGEALAVYTGSMLPENSLYVIRKEMVGVSGDTITVKQESAFERNYVEPGEECRKGEVILRKGEIVNYRKAVFLAHVGEGPIKVGVLPRVSILPVGSELLGKNVDPSGFMIKKLASRCSLTELRRPVPDSVEAISREVSELSSIHDIVITIGGTGFGAKDLTAASVQAAGGRILFSGVRISPGRTSGLAEVNGRPVLNLPGNLQAAVAAFFFLFPQLVSTLGFQACFEKIRIRMKDRIDVEGDPKIAFIRAEDGAGEVVEVTRHSLRFLLEANSLLIACKSVESGSEQEAYLI